MPIPDGADGRAWPRRLERYALVRRLIQSGAVRTEAVATAFMAMPRHEFLPNPLRSYAYRDTPLTLRERSGQRFAMATRPSQLARTLEALEISSGMRVLLLGVGSGFAAAVARHLVKASGQVTVLEENRTALRWVKARLDRVAPSVVLDDGTGGSLDREWDRVLVRTSHSDFPTIFDRLVPEGGRLALPFAWSSPLESLITAFEREGECWRATARVDGQGDPSRKPGEHAGRGPVETRAGFWVSAPALPREAQSEVWAKAVASRPDRCPIALAKKPSAVDWRSLLFWFSLRFGERVFLAHPGSLAGLVTPGGAGAAIGRDGGLRAWGDQPPVGDIEDVVGDWARAGKPPLERFRMVARRRDDPAAEVVDNPGSEEAADGDAMQWRSLRPHHTFLVTLPGL